MGVGNVQFRAPCPVHALHLREFHEVMNLVSVTLPPIQSSAVKVIIQSLSKEDEWLMACNRRRHHGCQREKTREDSLFTVHLHLSVRCKHILYRRLRLEGINVDDPFDAVHPQTTLGQTEMVGGKVNLSKRSKPVNQHLTLPAALGVPHRVDIIPSTSINLQNKNTGEATKMNAKIRLRLRICWPSSSLLHSSLL